MYHPTGQIGSERPPKSSAQKAEEACPESHGQQAGARVLPPGRPLPTAIGISTLVFLVCTTPPILRAAIIKQGKSDAHLSCIPPRVLTYPAHPPHRSCDPAIQPRGPLPSSLFCSHPPSLPPSHPSSPALQKSSLKHLDSFALCRALGSPSSCSFTGSIPEGATSPRPPTGPRTVCLHLPWWQGEVG